MLSSGIPLETVVLLGKTDFRAGWNIVDFLATSGDPLIGETGAEWLAFLKHAAVFGGRMGREDRRRCLRSLKNSFSSSELESVPLM